MGKLRTFGHILGRYKYLITIVIGVAIVGVFSEYSVVNLIKLDMQKSDLKQEVERYRQLDADARRQLDALKKTNNAVEKVARERYFMKRDDEDVFVLSTTPTDIPTIGDINATEPAETVETTETAETAETTQTTDATE